MGHVVYPDIQNPDTNAAQPLASCSDSRRLSICEVTGPFMFQMMEWLALTMNSTSTCMHCPWKPVMPSTLVTLVGLIGCTRPVFLTASHGKG